MNTQQDYLLKQKSQIEAEMVRLEEKNKRLMFRYNQLKQQRVAVEEDLKSLTSVTRKRADLKLNQVRHLQLEPSTTKS